MGLLMILSLAGCQAFPTSEVNSSSSLASDDSVSSSSLISNEGESSDSMEQKTYAPGLIETTYPTEENIVADYIAYTEQGLDPKGINDSSEALKKVLSDAEERGGGVVYLPAGKYLITENIYIPPFVTIRGDYCNPDSDMFKGDYGTVILAEPEVSATETRNPILGDRDDIYTNFPALFSIGGSAGLVGVTIYYPKQNIDHVIPYPFAVEIPSFAAQGIHANHEASTVKNVTFLNCYKGIIAGASASAFSNGYAAAFEQVHIENIKGTFLYQGMQLYIASEIGVVKKVMISPKYWAENTLGNQPELVKVKEYTHKYTLGMLLGDLEWLHFSDITINDLAMGIRIYDSLRRFFTNTIYFMGMFENLQVRGSQTAMRVDNLFDTFGMSIADSVLEGSIYALDRRDTTTAVIRLVNTALNGDIYGQRIYLSSAEEAYASLKSKGALASTERPYLKMPDSRNFIDAVKDYQVDNTAAQDASEGIQKALNDAAAAGGGIVYLKPGYYILKNKLIVYENTELRGSAGVSTRDQIGSSKGTVLLGFYGYSSSDLAKNADALVTLNGKGAGLRGIRFIYPENKPTWKADVKYKYHSYVVRILAESCYVAQASIVGVPFGIEISNTSNVTISEVSGTYYEIGVHIVGCNNIYLDEMLENAAVLARIGYGTVPALQKYFLYGWPTDSDLSTVYANLTRSSTVLFKAENTTNLSIVHCGAFGIQNFYVGTNSAAKVLQASTDNFGGNIFVVSGGTLNVVNNLRFNDIDYVSILNGGVFNAFNEVTLHFNTSFTPDADYVNNVQVASSLASSGADHAYLPDRYVY
jgi:Mor family transcriptional regulator